MNRLSASGNLGTALGRAGRWEEPCSLLEESRALLHQLGAPLLVPGLASALPHSGVRFGVRLAELRQQIELVEVASRCGHEAESRAALARAYDLAALIECKRLGPSIHEAAATLAAELEDPKLQIVELREAHRLYAEFGATGHGERLGRVLADSKSPRRERSMSSQLADAVFTMLCLTPEGRASPRPLYHPLREARPVHRAHLGLWLVSRYDDCWAAMRDPRFGKNYVVQTEQRYGPD